MYLIGDASEKLFILISTNYLQKYKYIPRTMPKKESDFSILVTPCNIFSSRYVSKQTSLTGNKKNDR